MKVLLVDDDGPLRLMLARSLERQGFVAATASGVEAMEGLLASQQFDVVVLDRNMPGESGLSACARLRARGGPPVIMLSAFADELDRIEGLELGADRYLAKPCSGREVAAQIRAVLRNWPGRDVRARRIVRFLGWRVDKDSHEVFDATGALVQLTDGEFGILRVFLERPRRVLSREDLIIAARGSDSESLDRAVDIQVSRLRRKLGAGKDEVIRTIRSEGYMFVPRVETDVSS